MLFALLLACATPTPANAPPPASSPPAAPAPPPPPEATQAPPPEDQPLSPTAPGPTVTPQQMYEGCRDRVEGVESEKECATDADCTRAGCSQEVCVAKAHAEEVMTTCELLPCFTVLDACGCHDGRCTWTLKAEAPLRRRPELP